MRMVHYYRNKIKREREKKEKPAPLPDTLTALKLEVVNSYLMDALVRLSENERSITGNEPKKVQLRIACIEAIIKIRNSIEASREMGAGTIILGETHPRVAEFTLAMIPKKKHGEYLDGLAEIEKELTETLEKDGGIIT